ncbi:glycoside hydrolase family 1 protein [Vibrio barjaei]|uniref:glycoside hydrolase family 1 protein n=1 Tax=Vibrio barjaei TaxID=1676683 RepID=UPI0007BB0F10|nr:glycoside hydrolase family 1 protein [Vibrio barjaei]OIN26297.1 6-phospho-beta-glucosidase [Vibrio barjaei]
MTQYSMKFPEGFILGAAASAWQTEGWSGKKDSQDSYIDAWYKNDRKVWHNGYGPAVATDFYNRYVEDIDLMQVVGLTHYRSSINWSRFMLDYEQGIVDEEYADYVDKVIDTMLAKGIEPMFCLEHYELPANLLEHYGGWSSPKVVDMFVHYAEEVFKRYAHKVKYWFSFNEPIVVQTRVYLDAIRYPYEQDTNKWMVWNHAKNLATAKIVKAYRDQGYDGKIGVVLNPEVTYPRSSAVHDKRAAEIYDLFYNRVFLDPAIKGEYPAELLTLLRGNGIDFAPTEEDLAIIKHNTVDFIGANLYYPHRVKAPEAEWPKHVPFHPKKYFSGFDLPGREMNFSRGWEIDPAIVYDMAMRIKNEYGNIEWILSENGMGIENEAQFKDEQGQIQDDYRIDFISRHLFHLLRAIEDGANCKGYMLWAFTDNVSPMNAFKNRYGLVEIDLEDNRNRRVKKSGQWYKTLSETRCLDINLDDEYR